MDSTKNSKPCRRILRVFLFHSHHIKTSSIHCHLYGTPDRTVNAERGTRGVKLGGGGLNKVNGTDYWIKNISTTFERWKDVVCVCVCVCACVCVRVCAQWGSITKNALFLL